MDQDTDVVVIGAGPYGLSIAAHLAARNADFRVFGTPMGVWRDHMPQGMFLKSEGFASTLFDPDRKLTLERYCAAHGHPYAAIGLPISRELFCDYGIAFQQRFVPDLQTDHVADVAALERGFTVRLGGGETFRARRVIVATGISHYAYVPPELAGLPPEVVSHTSQQRRLEDYAGRRVAVLGAGSSAIDMAGLLHQAGAETQLLTRRTKIWFNDPPVEMRGLRRLASSVKRPRSGLGLGWRSRMACDLPTVFHHLPSGFRIRVTRGHLGPSASWMARRLVEGKVTMRLGMTLRSAELRNGKPCLTFVDGDGGSADVAVDHVVAGTGYKVDMDRLPFLAPDLRNRIGQEQKTPILSRNFESTVRGLYFTGVSAANSFGPLLRFAWGARFTADRLTSHLVH